MSSPIKFLEYISCGVNVIMTDAVPSYAKIVKDNQIGTIISLDADHFLINHFSPDAKEIYEKFFNRKTYVDRYRKLMSKL